MLKLQTIITLGALAIFAVVLSDFVKAFVESKQTGARRFIDAGRGSATIVVAQLGALAASLVAAGDKATDWICNLLNTPEVAEQVKTFIGQYFTATNVGLAMLAFTAAVTWARLRTLGKPAANG